MNPKVKKWIKIGVFALVLLVVVLIAWPFKVVRVGHEAVPTLFGRTGSQSYGPGFHIVNPLYAWEDYDVRAKTLKDEIPIPSQDQLITEADVSVQYRIDKTLVTVALDETGNAEDLVNVHLIPNLRSIVREQGKTVPRAQDFYLESVQNNLQAGILADMQAALGPKGIIVEAVLLRRFDLPPFIVDAIEKKKEREQLAEQQLAELERFKTEQEQLIATANAEKQAAALEAEKVKLLADAQAYEIKAINEAISDSPAYIQLQALKSLEAIAKDPSAKLYFIDDASPVPLMHFGEFGK